MLNKKPLLCLIHVLMYACGWLLFSQALNEVGKDCKASRLLCWRYKRHDLAHCHLAQVVVRSPSAHASLMDALAISEFLAAFGVVCEAAVLGLADVQKSVARPLTSSVLSKAYMSLLRCVLLEKVHFTEHIAGCLFYLSSVPNG